MPTYDYFCPSNGRTVTVQHPMSVSLRTWGELSERAEIDAPNGGSRSDDSTPAGAPIERLMSRPMVSTGSKAGLDAPSGGFGGGCGCGAGGCGGH